MANVKNLNNMETNKEKIKQCVYDLISCHDRGFDSTEDLVVKIENEYLKFLEHHLSKQTETMEQRKIIGYKSIYNIKSWNIKKNSLFILNTFGDYEFNGIGIDGRKEVVSLPREIVETWEPVYEEEKLEIVDWKIEDNYTNAWIMFKGKLTQEIIDKIKEVINDRTYSYSRYNFWRGHYNPLTTQQLYQKSKEKL